MPEGAILQRDKETYAIVPRTPAGVISPEILENMAKVVRDYNIPIVKITSGQRIALVGIKEDEVDKVWKDLGMDVGRAIELCVHYVQACPGTAVCKFGVQDSLGLGTELESLFYEKELPAKFKIAVSGCHFCCAESYLRDFGVLATKKGWNVIVGGNSGRLARIGDVVAENVSKEEVIELCKKFMDFYMENAKKKERSSKFVARVGIEAVKEAIL